MLTISRKQLVGLALLVLVAATLISTLLFRHNTVAIREYQTAKSLWFSDCNEGLARCAQQWDDGVTLRSIYLDRARQ
jgi:hypothetical protein